MSFTKEMEFAKKTAREVGEYIVSRHGGDFKVDAKFEDLDFVTEVDQGAEDRIRQALTAQFPYPFIGEEDDKTDEEIVHYLNHMEKDDICWVVDPIDGTLNFMQGLPGYGVMIALVQGGQPVMGVIYLPYMDEMFYAQKGQGAWLDGERIHVTETSQLADAFLGFGTPVTNMEYRQVIADHLAALVTNIWNMRALGSAAQSMAYVAAGRLDTYWTIGLKPWDVAAGKIIIEEAGGEVTNFQGKPYRFGESHVLSSNRHINPQLLPYISKE